jgi:cyanophycin synthetase
VSDFNRRLPLIRFFIRLRRLLNRLFGREKTVYVDERVAEYRGYWSGAAKHLSAEFVNLSEDVWEVRLGDRRTRIANYVTEADDPVTLHVAGDKPYCLRVAQNVGLPVALVGVYELGDWPQMLSAFRAATGPLVVKPAAGSSSGLGITTQIETQREFERAIVLASLYNPTILIERSVPAESVRLLFLNGEMLHAVRRRGVRVEGDGSSTIRRLLRGIDHRSLETDRLCLHTLAVQGRSLDSVPERGRSILVRSIPTGDSQQRELRTVYDESITNLISPELRDRVSTLVQTLRCRFVGVDVLSNDPSVSLEKSGGVFLEINTTPGIHHHYHTVEERETHPVAVRVLEYLLNTAPPITSNAVGVGAYEFNRPEGNIRG